MDAAFKMIVSLTCLAALFFMTQSYVRDYQARQQQAEQQAIANTDALLAEVQRRYPPK